jgi:hypothetical protein
MTYECREQGCGRGPATGHALYRTSPKGDNFEGACDEHFSGETDPIVQAIQDRNLGTKSRPPRPER